jgi:hypothetical protein
VSVIPAASAILVVSAVPAASDIIGFISRVDHDSCISCAGGSSYASCIDIVIISLMFIIKYTYKRVGGISSTTQLLECSKELISIDYTDKKAVDNL